MRGRARGVLVVRVRLARLLVPGERVFTVVELSARDPVEQIGLGGDAVEIENDGAVNGTPSSPL